jgi:hypothetical protein
MLDLLLTQLVAPPLQQGPVRLPAPDLENRRPAPSTQTPEPILGPEAPTPCQPEAPAPKAPTTVPPGTLDQQPLPQLRGLVR